MGNSSITILITSSVIAHDPGVTLKDSNERIRLTLFAIGKWIRYAPECSITLCDGSNYDFSQEIKAQFPKHKIECLHFKNNISKVVSQGRGYGEGEIVKYAIENSHLIKETNSFAKCSAKLWVKNFQTCLLNWNGKFQCHGVFHNSFSLHEKLALQYVDTRFYVANTNFYNSHFLNTHDSINKKNGIGLEDKFLDTIQNIKLKHIFFRTPPIIEGVGGGTGSFYKTSFLRHQKEKMKILIASKHKNFQNYY